MGTPADPSKRSAKSKAPTSKASAPKVSTPRKPRKPTPPAEPVVAARNGVNHVAIPSEQRHERIALTAYYLAEARQFEPGYEEQDWFAAERLVASTDG